ncbi:MAG: 50S ribosomal protein L10 [Vampirovibrionales bacterium]|nr:50S ribosomal protein L10 [Vampirovibrionales bacterium]
MAATAEKKPNPDRLHKRQYVNKQAKTDVLKTAVANASIALVFDYRGLSVAELFALRKALRAVGASLNVSKNTLIIRAIEGTDASVLTSILAGPTALLTATGDQVAPVKAIKEFLKANKKKNALRGALLDGQLLSAQEVDALADMPSREVLLGKLVGAIAYPQQQLVGTLLAPQRQLANVLDQFAKTKEGAA